MLEELTQLLPLQALEKSMNKNLKIYFMKQWKYEKENSCDLVDY